MPLREALVRAGRTRFRPILMTSLCTILGLIPLALGMGPGAQMQQPLAIAVIGGLITNMLLTRLLIPVGYLVAECDCGFPDGTSASAGLPSLTSGRGEPVMARVLVVEDQKRHLDSLRRGLESEGYEVATACTGEDGLALATGGEIDAIVLDLMLPGRDGLSIVRELRSSGFAKPILILTARDAVEDRVQGLNEGADDYLVKPFAFAEFLARLHALLRANFSGRELVLRAGDLEMDLLNRRVTRTGAELELTGREYELLEYLLRHKNKVVTRDMIALDVWKEKTGAMTRIIDVYINALRKKVDRIGRPALIQTVRGVGYALRESP